MYLFLTNLPQKQDENKMCDLVNSNIIRAGVRDFYICNVKALAKKMHTILINPISAMRDKGHIYI